MVFVEHDEDEGEPGTEERKCGGGNLGGKDTVLHAENRGAGYAEEELVLGDILCHNWAHISKNLVLQNYRLQNRRGIAAKHVVKTVNLPTPLPASLFLRSSSWIFGLISAPFCRSHAKKAWLAPSKSAMGKSRGGDVGCLDD